MTKLLHYVIYEILPSVVILAILAFFAYVSSWVYVNIIEVMFEIIRNGK